MAFNKGLKIVDSNTPTRNSISLEELDKGIFQSSANGASGSAVFTIRAARNDDAAGAYQEIIKGQNLVIGIQYNTAGDQYRLVVQNAVDFKGNGGASSGAGFGSYVATDTETTYGLTYSDNGTVMLQQSGGRLQTLDIGNWSAPTAQVVLEENGIASGDIGHLILDDQKGNLIDIRPEAIGANNADLLLNSIVTAWDALDDVDVNGKAGFNLAVANNKLTIKRDDKADFKLSFGDDLSGNILKNVDADSKQPSVAFLKIASVTNSSNYSMTVTGSVTLTAVVAADSSATVAEVVSALETALKADSDYAGSTFSVSVDPTNSDVLVIKDSSGAPFTIGETAGTASYNTGQVLISDVNNPPLAADKHDDGDPAVQITNITKSGFSTHSSDLLSRDFDGFISQVAIFDAPLSTANLSSYVNTPSTIPTPTLSTNASPTSVVLDLYGDAAQNTKKYGLVLDAGNGNTLVIADQTAGAATEVALLGQINTAFAALSTADKKGFAIDSSVTGQLTISRADGADFTITPSTTSDYTATNVGQFRANGVSLKKTDGPTSLEIKINNATASDKYFFIVDETSDIEFGATAAASGETASTLAVKLYDAAVALGTLEPAGYTLALNAARDGVIISRVDGKTFDLEIGSNTAPDYVSGDVKISNNGATLANFDNNNADVTIAAVTASERQMATSATSIVPASADLELVNAFGSSHVGEVYAFTLDDGNASNAVAVSTFVAGNTADNKAIVAALKSALDPDANGIILNDSDADGLIDDDTGFRVSLDPTTQEKLTLSRADGTNFTVKLATTDEAGNLKFRGTTVDSDTGVTTVNGSSHGQVATISNNVVQNFDFSILSATGVSSVTSKGPSDGFAGAATVEVHGLAKSDGSSLVQLGSAQGYLITAAVTQGYEGAAVVSSGGTASDVLFVQLRNVEAQGNGRKMTADIFVDPALLGDDAYQALSYKVAFSSALTLESFTQMTTTGGFDLIDTTSTADTVAARWFQPTAVTDFTQPIATMVLVDDATGTTNPSFTFSEVDIDGTDFTDNSTYSLTFVDSLDANLVDIGDRLVHGNDETTGVAGELVAVEASTGTALAPTPASGLYLTLSDWSATASAANPDVTFDLNLKTATSTAVISFEVDLPAGASATTFTLDPALAGVWTVTTNQVDGRTLKVVAEGVANLAAGGTLGTVSSTVVNGHGSASQFELTNVQTDADAANESGRGVYVGTTTTKSSAVAADVGKWIINDLPVGVMSRYYEGAREVTQSKLTAADALHALQISAGLTPSWYTGSSLDGQELAADFDGSGKVTAADALAILQASVAETLDARATWKFFDNETTTLTPNDVASNLKTLKVDTSISANNAALGQGDMVVLIGDLSDPSLG